MGVRVTSDDLATSHAVSYAASGASLAIILLLAQTGVSKPSQLWALVFAAAAMPLFISIAVSEQTWTMFKVRYSDVTSTPEFRQIYSRAYFGAAGCLVASIACLVLSLSVLAAAVFALSVGLGVLFGSVAIGVGAAKAGLLSEDDDGKKTPPR